MDVFALTETTGYIIVGVFAAVASVVGVLVASRAQRQASSATSAAASIDSALHGQRDLIDDLRKEVDRLKAARESDLAEIRACHEQRDALTDRVKALEAAR